VKKTFTYLSFKLNIKSWKLTNNNNNLENILTMIKTQWIPKRLRFFVNELPLIHI